MSMIARGRILMCDHPDCTATARWPDRTWPSPPDLRRWAMEQRGWSRDGRGGDRCPDHAARGGAIAMPANG